RRPARKCWGKENGEFGDRQRGPPALSLTATWRHRVMSHGHPRRGPRGSVVSLVILALVGWACATSDNVGPEPAGNGGNNGTAGSGGATGAAGNSGSAGNGGSGNGGNIGMTGAAGDGSAAGNSGTAGTTGVAGASGGST